MATPTTDTALKVCRHCSVASRTDSATCPSCGRPYERRLWRWWFAIPIVALAFGGGYVVRKAVQDDEPAGLTLEEARAIAVGDSPARLEQVLDGQRPRFVRRQGAGGNELLCRYYEVVDEENVAWEVCLLNGRLEVSKPLDVEPR